MSHGWLLVEMDVDVEMDVEMEMDVDTNSVLWTQHRYTAVIQQEIILSQPL